MNATGLRQKLLDACLERYALTPDDWPAIEALFKELDGHVEERQEVYAICREAGVPGGVLGLVPCVQALALKEEAAYQAIWGQARPLIVLPLDRPMERALARMVPRGKT